MKVRILIVFILFSISSSLIFSQKNSSQNNITEQKVNQDIWFPFSSTFKAFDAIGFMAIHTDDVIRISRDGKSIRTREEYTQSQIESAERNVTKKRTRSISFSFTERFYKGDLGYESGYYKVVYNQNKEDSFVSYGYFNVVLKRQKGKWKIFLDSDSSLENSLKEEDFIKGQILVK
jgi:ketosteroid isomerase-like protein